MRDDKLTLVSEKRLRQLLEAELAARRFTVAAYQMKRIADALAKVLAELEQP